MKTIHAPDRCSIGADVGFAAGFLTAVLPGLPAALVAGQWDVVLLRLALLLRVNDSLLDVRGQRIERLIDVDIALCRDFEERHAEFVCKRLSFLCRYGALLFPIAFVANEDLVDALGGVLFDVREPCPYICESRVSNATLQTRDLAARSLWPADIPNVLSKLRLSVTSYTKRIPMAPL